MQIYLKDGNIEHIKHAQPNTPKAVRKVSS